MGLSFFTGAPCLWLLKGHQQEKQLLFCWGPGGGNLKRHTLVEERKAEDTKPVGPLSMLNAKDMVEGPHSDRKKCLFRANEIHSGAPSLRQVTIETSSCGGMLRRTDCTGWGSNLSYKDEGSFLGKSPTLEI